jgi:hypothetical protein
MFSYGLGDGIIEGGEVFSESFDVGDVVWDRREGLG